ncbi:MAG: tetratricopeptide repeat protein [Pseudomonadota bacterium]
MIRFVFLGSVFALATFPAHAQLSVTTIGATDAAACYRAANDQLSSDTDACDRALRDQQTTRGDRLKTLINRGIIHNRNNAVQAAIDDFNAALEIDDASAEAYLNRGNSWFRAGRYEDALTDYKRALALEVSKPWAAWYNIGLVHDARGDSDSAQQAYETALTLNPNFSLAQQKLASKKQEGRQ